MQPFLRCAVVYILDYAEYLFFLLHLGPFSSLSTFPKRPSPSKLPKYQYNHISPTHSIPYTPSAHPAITYTNGAPLILST